MSGYVYVLSNPCMDVLKIGMTAREPHQRARELSSQTPVPKPFKVEYAHACDDPKSLELRAHMALSDHRVNDKREFFDVTAEQAKDAIQCLSEGESVDTDKDDRHEPDGCGCHLKHLIPHKEGQCGIVSQAFIIGEIDEASKPCPCPWSDDSPHKKSGHELMLSMKQIGPFGEGEGNDHLVEGSQVFS